MAGVAVPSRDEHLIRTLDWQQALTDGGDVGHHDTPYGVRKTRAAIHECRTQCVSAVRAYARSTFSRTKLTLSFCKSRIRTTGSSLVCMLRKEIFQAV